MGDYKNAVGTDAGGNVLFPGDRVTTPKGDGVVDMRTAYNTVSVKLDDSNASGEHFAAFPAGQLRKKALSKRAKIKALGDLMKERVITKAALTEVAGSTGGYLVPDELAMDIDAGFLEQSFFAQRAHVQPMVSRECRKPILDVTASHANGTSPMLGGIQLSWMVDGVALTPTNQKYEQMTLVARNLQGLIYVSNQLVQDGGEALGAHLMLTASQALAWSVDYACFNGNGVQQPQGVLTAGASYQLPRGSAGVISQQDIANMVAHLFPASFVRACWCCSLSALTDIANLSTYMANRNADSSQGAWLCGTLFGRPVFVTEKLPVLGTPGDLVLIDPYLYVLGSRAISLDWSGDTPQGFFNQQTIFRLIWRGDAKPSVSGTATLQDGSTVAGAFVVLN